MIFAMTFVIRAIYEAILYYRSIFIINRIPGEFELSLETMINGLVTYQLPIGLIVYLHERNTRSIGKNGKRLAT